MPFMSGADRQELERQEFDNVTFARDGADGGLLVPTIGPNERQRRRDANLARDAVVRGTAQALLPATFHYDTGNEVVGQSMVVHPTEEPEPESERGPYNLRRRLLDAERLAERRSGYRSSPGLQRLQEYRVNRTLGIVAQWLLDMIEPPVLGMAEWQSSMLVALSEHVNGQILWTEAPNPQEAS